MEQDEERGKLQATVFDELQYLFYSYWNSLIYAAISVLGIVAAMRLIGRTRNKGPLIILVASIAKIVVGISFPVSNYFFNDDFDNYVILQPFWLGLSFLDIVASALLGLGLLLVAVDFRALLEVNALTQDSQTNRRPHSK